LHGKNAALDGTVAVLVARWMHDVLAPNAGILALGKGYHVADGAVNVGESNNSLCCYYGTASLSYYHHLPPPPYPPSYPRPCRHRRCPPTIRHRSQITPRRRARRHTRYLSCLLCEDTDVAGIVLRHAM